MGRYNFIRSLRIDRLRIYMTDIIPEIKLWNKKATNPLEQLLIGLLNE